MFKKALLSAAVVSALTAGSLSMPSAAHATVTDPTGKYTAVSPTRIADSRSAARLHTFKANETQTLQVAGLAGVPKTGVQAVVVNITAVNPSAAGYLTAYPSGTSRPNTSNSNYPKGWTGATTATVPVGADGKIAIFAGNTTVNVVVDVLGWYAAKGSTAAPGSLFGTLDAERIADTRTDGGGPMLPGDELVAGYYFSDMPAGVKVTGFAVNVTAVGQSSGYFTAFAQNATKIPTTSIVNFAKGETSPNFAIVPASGSNATGYYFTVANTSNGTAHLIIDLVGVYFTDTQNIGLTHQAFAPTRVADTRTGLGVGNMPLEPKSGRAVPVSPNLFDADRTFAIEGTMTAANPTANTYLSLLDPWAADVSDPGVSTLNVAALKNRSNVFVAQLRELNMFTWQVGVYNSSGNVDLVADLNGRFDATDEMLADVNNPAGSPLAKMSSARAFKSFAHGTIAPTRRGSIR